MLFPMLAKQTEATSLTDFINSDQWVFEQKLDGHRLLLCSPGGDFPPVAMTRNGTPYTRKLPQGLVDFRFPQDTKPHSWILDGELVDGQFWVFDIPASPQTGTGETLRWRRDYLELFVNGMKSPAIKLVPHANTKAKKIALAEVALKENYEGLVIKKARSTYQPGRSDAWLKLKFVTTAECVVLAVRDDGKESVRLGMYGPSVGAFSPKGAIATKDRIMHDVGRASLIGKEKHGKINVGDVVEVRYLYAGAGNRLYQPTILRKRDDKLPEQCTTGQMKFVNKSVLEKL